jgi:hypothetical protein
VGDKGARTEQHARNLWHGGRNDREWRSLSPEGLGPKGFGSNVYDACWTKRFCAPNNIVKYDGKTNLSDWLVDYHITCRAGGADNDLFIIQFLPIYLVDMS